ncbi:hypothetical protein GCM10022381_26080 [Leifsonia kafniensis]|uniref:Uncharacterized protein n=1 Tax=Leifsonia kafniensis TaxID=475957 RepID=A0ABP7KQI3_9MICO
MIGRREFPSAIPAHPQQTVPAPKVAECPLGEAWEVFDLGGCHKSAVCFDREDQDNGTEASRAK